MTSSRRFPPFAKPGVALATSAPAQQELPSIDLFLDELPPVEDFLAETEQREAPAFIDEPPPVSVDSSAEGWASGDWQSYDWSSLSSLKRTMPRAGAAEEWGESEWPDDDTTDSYETMHDRSKSGMLSVDDIAEALDGIARRLRSGELVIDNLHGTSPEAAMAAALAVLLRMRG